jgi:hypothetical protein
MWTIQHIRLLICLVPIIIHSSMGAYAEEMDHSFEFPELLDSSDIEYFSKSFDVEGLFWALEHTFLQSNRNTDKSGVKYSALPNQLVARGGGDTYTAEYKLKMDLEQAQYLADLLKVSDPDKADLLEHTVIPAYKTVLDRIPSAMELSKFYGLYPFTKSDMEILHNVYNQAWHLTNVPQQEHDLLSESFDANFIQNEWNRLIQNGQPGIVTVDNLLSKEALSKIQKLLMESTVWYQTKMPLKFGGYVGAYIDDGLYDKILLQLAFELNQKLPQIMKNHYMKYLWAYKYDSTIASGINIHADQAAVNVNIWLTPEDANLDKTNGGLVIFTAKPPPDWNFQQYNTDTERVIKDLLQPTGFANVTVPYRENRAVIFDSALFHHTDEFHFQEGYRNHRINLTILYGDMNHALEKDGEMLDAEL